MSEKVKTILDKTNKVLGVLCAVLFIIAACRITYIAKVYKIEDNRELIMNIK